MKWAATEPAMGQFRFEKGDAIVGFANSHNQKVRGHNLVWGEYNPSWLEGGNFNATGKLAILKNHIQNVVSHFKGKVIAWDVVNEAILDNPSYNNVFKRNVWYPDIPDYVDLAFQWASQTDPNVKLFYNDFSAEGSGPKADAVYEMVRSMKQRGIPIHGVGLQFHVSLQYSPNIPSVYTNIQRLVALGLEVHITEMDVSIKGGSGSQSQILAAQAGIYSNVMRACMLNVNCTAFVTWGFTDRYTWLSSSEQPLLYDMNYQPKPSYNALVSVLNSS